MKTFSVMGDSISTFPGCNPEGNEVFYEGENARQTGVGRVEDTWWFQAIEACGGRLLANGSYSGSLVSGDAFPAGCSAERAAQLLGAAGEAPDAVLVYMGINDYGEGVLPCDFERAYEAMLVNVGNMAPTAQIFCLTLLSGCNEEHDLDFFRSKYKGENLEDYNAAIRRAATACGAQVIDVAAAGAPFHSFDGTHPTRQGMRQLAVMFLDAFAR